MMAAHASQSTAPSAHLHTTSRTESVSAAKVVGWLVGWLVGCLLVVVCGGSPRVNVRGVAVNVEEKGEGEEIRNHCE